MRRLNMEKGTGFVFLLQLCCSLMYILTNCFQQLNLQECFLHPLTFMNWSHPTFPQMKKLYWNEGDANKVNRNILTYAMLLKLLTFGNHACLTRTLKYDTYSMLNPLTEI